MIEITLNKLESAIVILGTITSFAGVIIQCWKIKVAEIVNRYETELNEVKITVDALDRWKLQHITEHSMDHPIKSRR